MTNYVIDYSEVKTDIELAKPDVIIQTGISKESLKLAKKIAQKDEVDYLIHYRNRDEIEYQTQIFLKDENVVLINGDLTTGYTGSGTSAFKLLLMHLGLHEDTAENIAVKRNNGLDKAKIEIKFY